MQIKAILFDIDGTLVDSNDMHLLAWEEAFAGIGERFDRQVVHDQIGKGTDMLVPTLLPDLDEAALDKLAAIGADEVIVVGDTPYDIEAAKTCGIAVIGLRSGRFSDEMLRDAGAIEIYDDAAALLASYADSALGR